jgi:phosphate transport system ATP-binding protein
LYVDTSEGSRTGYLAEFGGSGQIFHDPWQKETHQYSKGEFS